MEVQHSSAGVKLFLSVSSERKWKFFFEFSRARAGLLKKEKLSFMFPDAIKSWVVVCCKSAALIQYE